VYVIEPQGNCFLKNISVVMYELLTVLFISFAVLHWFCVLSNLSKCWRKKSCQFGVLFVNLPDPWIGFTQCRCRCGHMLTGTLVLAVLLQWLWCSPPPLSPPQADHPLPVVTLPWPRPVGENLILHHTTCKHVACWMNLLVCTVYV